MISSVGEVSIKFHHICAFFYVWSESKNISALYVTTWYGRTEKESRCSSSDIAFIFYQIFRIGIKNKMKAS